MKKQNLLVLGIVVALIIAVALIAIFVPQTRSIPENAPAVEMDQFATQPAATETAAPETTEAAVEATAAPEATEAAVEATAAPEATEAAVEATAAPEATETAAEGTAPTATEMPAVEAYLVISVQGAIYEPLPLGGEGVFTIKQDENTTNTVHITPDSVWMEHSSCDNQDCVDQGTVTLENMESRVLYNMIICLPNQVVLELHTAETLASAFGLTE